MPSNIRERIEKSLGRHQRAVVWAYWSSFDTFTATNWVIDGSPGDAGTGVGFTQPHQSKPFKDFLTDGWRIVSVTPILFCRRVNAKVPGAVFTP